MSVNKTGGEGLREGRGMRGGGQAWDGGEVKGESEKSRVRELR